MSKWNKKPLFKIADIRLSNVDKKILDGEIPVRLCNYMDAYSNDYLDGNIPYSQGSVKLSEIDRFGLMRGDVLITKDSETPDDIAVPAVVIDDLEKVICGYHLAILRSKNDVLDGVFLMNALKEYSTRQWFIRKANGITRYGLSKSSIENAEINYPDIARQRKIARILIKVDKVIKQTEKAIEKLKSIKQGMMHDLFTRGIDVKTGKLRPPHSEAPEIYKETELGWIPKEWDVTTILKSIYLKGRIGWQGLKAEEFTIEGPYLVTGTDFKDDLIDWPKCYHISQRRFEEAPSIHLQNNDVLITKDGTIGKIALVTDCPQKAILNSGIFVMRSKEERIINKFFFYTLKSEIFSKFLCAYQGGSTINHLYQREFERFSFPVPKKPEQERFIRKMDSINAHLINEKNKYQKYQCIKKGLMQDLLTGRIDVSLAEEKVSQ